MKDAENWRDRARELDYRVMHWVSHTNKGAKTGVRVAIGFVVIAAAVLRAIGS